MTPQWIRDEDAKLRKLLHDEMLEALKLAELWLDAAYDDGEGREAYDKVCAAIRKATGEA